MASPTFQSARVCVLLRQKRPLPEGETRGELIYDYEVLAWPPGTTDGGLLPQAADVITLPGHDRAFIVMERAIHWPAPTSPEGRRGEVQVNLGVEPVEQDLDPLTRSPFGRPGEAEIRREGRWLPARVTHYEARTSFGGENYVRVDFAIDGIGILCRQIRRNWQALEMFPAWTGFQNAPSHEGAPQGAVLQCLQVGQEFEVRVAPSELPSQAGRLEIWEVRPTQKPEPADLANTWDQNAQELTDELWGGGQ